MRKRKNVTSLVVALCLFCLISITVGYAFLERKMEIKGVTDVASTKWDVHFDNIVIKKEKATVVTAANLDTDKTTLNFAVTLNKPGDVYEFYVDVVNAGTIDAMINILPSLDLPNKYTKYVDYKVTYADGTPLKPKDLLQAGVWDNGDLVPNTETLRVSMKYIASTTGDNLPTTALPAVTVELELPYVQANDTAVPIERNSLYQYLSDNAIMDNEESEFVGSGGINHVASTTPKNGKGLYTLATTESSEYPVKYYRGAVEDNNVLFAGFCWQIVRTTETGAIKMIYNGVPVNGVCDNTGLDTVLPGEVKYSDNLDYARSLKTYMFGEDLYTQAAKVIKATPEENLVFGNDVKFENGKYTLLDTVTTTTARYAAEKMDIAQSHHYTCFSDQSECDEVYYTLNPFGVTYVTLKNGMNIEAFYDELVGRTSKYSSNAKLVVDNWYKEKMVDFDDNIADSVWCVDRRNSLFESSGYDKNHPYSPTLDTGFDAERRTTFSNPSGIDLTCDIKDSYTVSNTNGNGKLDYKAGLLTNDEVALAGYKGGESYLINGVSYWTMSAPEKNEAVVGFSVNQNGGLSYTGLDNTHNYIRPVISLVNDILYSTGDGTKENPFVIVER